MGRRTAVAADLLGRLIGKRVVTDMRIDQRPFGRRILSFTLTYHLPYPLEDLRQFAFQLEELGYYAPSDPWKTSRGRPVNVDLVLDLIGSTFVTEGVPRSRVR